MQLTGLVAQQAVGCRVQGHQQLISAQPGPLRRIWDGPHHLHSRSRIQTRACLYGRLDSQLMGWCPGQLPYHAQRGWCGRLPSGAHGSQLHQQVPVALEGSDPLVPPCILPSCPDLVLDLCRSGTRAVHQRPSNPNCTQREAAHDHLACLLGQQQPRIHTSVCCNLSEAEAKCCLLKHLLFHCFSAVAKAESSQHSALGGL